MDGPINSTRPPLSLRSDDQMEKKGKKLPRLGMSANPIDKFIRSLRSYPTTDEKADKLEETSQLCSRPHPQSNLMVSSRSSSSCSRTLNSTRSTISSLN